MVFERWLFEETKFEMVTGLSQTFVRRDRNECISMMFAKVTDDIPMAGSIEDMNSFTDYLRKIFVACKIIIDDEMIFNGCTIVQDRIGNISMSMDSYMENLKPIVLSGSRRKMQSSLVDPNEVSTYRSLSGVLAWIGYATLPEAALASSLLQQRKSRRTVSDLCEANNMLKKLKKLNPSIYYEKPQRRKATATYSFSHAAFSISKSQSYGQTGIINGLLFSSHSTDAPIYHAIN